MAKDRWVVSKDAPVSETDALHSLSVVRRVYAVSTVVGLGILAGLWLVLPPAGQLALLVTVGIFSVLGVACKFGPPLIDWVDVKLRRLASHRDKLELAKRYGVNDE